MNQKPFCLDVGAVKKEGFESWSSQFSWPVPFLFYQDVFQDLFLQYLARIREKSSQRPFLADLLTICHKLTFEYSVMLYCAKVIQSLRAEGLPLSYSELSTHYKGLIEEGKPTAHTADILYGGHSQNGLLIRIKRYLRNWAKGWLYGGTHFLRFARTDRVMAVFQPNDLCREYLRGNKRKLIFLDLAELLANRPVSLEKGMASELEALCEQIVADVCAIAQKREIHLNKSHLDYVMDTARKQIMGCAQDYLAVQANIENYQPLHLFTGCIGGYYRRLVSAVVQSQGGEVTSFEHGGSTWHLYRHEVNNPYYIFNNMAAVSQYGLYNEAPIPNVQAAVLKSPMLEQTKFQLFSVQSEAYSSLSKFMQRQKLPSRVKTVMVMGTCFIGDRISLDYMPDVIRLDLEWRILQTLRRGGYKIIYKQHPGGVLNSPLYSSDETLTVSREPFENVMDQADAYLFYQSASTTLSYALCTKKPVIIIEPEDRQWGDDYALLAKRGILIKSTIDSANRLQFNENDLLEALSRPLEEPNNDFVMKYYFPKALR